MMLRWLVTNYLRQVAERRVREAVVETLQQRAADDLGGDDGVAGSRPEIAFVFATGVEADAMASTLVGTHTVQHSSFREHIGHLDNRPVVVVEMGTGAEAARVAATDLIARHRPDWVVSSGFAGALVEHVGRGHIVMADELVDLSGRRLSIGLKVAPESVQAVRGLHVGIILGVDRLISTPDEKRRLGCSSGALACDMESVAVAEVCRQVRTRCLSVRVISDAVDDRLPKEVENLVAQTSLAGKLGAVAGAALKRPSSIADMWRLQEEAQRLSARLAKVLRGVTQQLVDDA